MVHAQVADIRAQYNIARSQFRMSLGVQIHWWTPQADADAIRALRVLRFKELCALGARLHLAEVLYEPTGLYPAVTR